MHWHPNGERYHGRQTLGVLVCTNAQVHIDRMTRQTQTKQDGNIAGAADFLDNGPSPRFHQRRDDGGRRTKIPMPYGPWLMPASGLCLAFRPFGIWTIVLFTPSPVRPPPLA